MTEEIVDRGDELVVKAPEVVAPEIVKDDPKVKELEAEIEAEAVPEEPKDEPKKDSRIPLARHKEILEKEREQRAILERQLAQYQQGGQIADMNAQLTAAENNVAAMLKEYHMLLSDGELDKAGLKMDAIRRTERDMAEAKSDMKIHAAEIRATERARYGTALERVEAAFPTLNPDHVDYDEAIMSEVAELKEAYEMKGLTPTVALQKAVKALVEPRTTRQEMATNIKPNVTEKDIAAERKKEAVDKTMKAVAKTPPSLSQVGRDSDKLGGKISAEAVMAMNQKEFAQLSEAVLAELRGDSF